MSFDNVSSESLPTTGDPRILFMGMLNKLSLAALGALLESEADICAIFVPASELTNFEVSVPLLRLEPERRRSELSIVAPFISPNIVHMAWEANIPVYALNQIADPAVAGKFLGLNPDLVCVACFPQRVPASILTIPSLGFLNIHPSLLPDFRGPAPMFWIWRTGLTGASGVTLHYMDEDLDAGDIVLQAPIEYPDGTSGPEADRLAGTIGGRLLVEALSTISRGQLIRRPQSGDGSYYPWPVEADFELSTSWSARRAYNFMCGTAEWGYPYPVKIRGKRLELAEAIDFADGGTIDRPVVRIGDRVRLQFQLGILEATLLR